jgi:hypothetical protein
MSTPESSYWCGGLPPAGARIELVSLAPGPPGGYVETLQPGTKGTVTGSHAGQVPQLWVKWDDGSNLALLPGEDRWLVIEEEA